MQSDSDAAVLANADDPVQLKPFELLDDIFNAVRLFDAFNIQMFLFYLQSLLLSLMVVQVNDYTVEGFDALEE
jgi:hypothetical protein